MEPLLPLQGEVHLLGLRLRPHGAQVAGQHDTERVRGRDGHRLGGRRPHAQPPQVHRLYEGVGTANRSQPPGLGVAMF